jgi:hypothetical protein
MSALIKATASLKAIVLPWWAKWLALVVLLAAVYGAGRLHEARRAQDVHAAYVAKQAAQSVVIVKKQVRVVVQTEIEYRERIRKIYVQGEQIEKIIPQFVTPADVGRFGVNAGFVRVVDAAWSGESVGPTSDPDREPAGIPLDDVAAAQAGNATSCRAWREKVYGWREFYARQQVAINGKAGEWSHEQEP